MKVVVLGGGGFIGTHVSRLLLQSGYGDVRVFGRHFIDRPALKGADIYEGDFNDETVLATALQGADIVLHLIHATFPTAANVEMAADIQRSVVGSVRLLEAARAHGVKRVIFFSSGGTVYGPVSQIPITEAHPTNPIGAYGINKLMIEKYVSLYEHLFGIKGYILRIANPFGPLQSGARQQGLVPNVYHNIVAGRDIPVYGDGSNVRDYVYIDDVADAVRRMLTYEGPERCFNVGSATGGHSIREVIQAVAGAVGIPAKLNFLPARSFDVPANVLSCDRLIAETGWQPQVTFTDGIGRAVHWLNSVNGNS